MGFIDRSIGEKRNGGRHLNYYDDDDDRWFLHELFLHELFLHELFLHELFLHSYAHTHTHTHTQHFVDMHAGEACAEMRAEYELTNFSKNFNDYRSAGVDVDRALNKKHHLNPPTYIRVQKEPAKVCLFSCFNPH